MYTNLQSPWWRDCHDNYTNSFQEGWMTKLIQTDSSMFFLDLQQKVI